MTRQLEGAVALVTGGAAGIGKAAALAFAEQGAKVAIADLKVDRGNELADAVERSGGKAIFVRTDVSRTGDVEELIGKTVTAFGRIDCAFNNAGIEGTLATTADCTEENFDRSHQNRGARVRQERHPHQRHLPGRYPYRDD